jgi:NitT/TauT family transport system substrate-binding protein
MSESRTRWTRRKFVQGVTLAGTAGLLGIRPEHAAAEPSPETTTLRLMEIPALCWAPQYVAEELLRAEGFSRVQYVKKEISPKMFQPLGSGEAHMTMGIAGPLMMQIDAGEPIVLLAGVHVGCYELFGTGRIRTIRDLKGKTVGVQGLGGGAHVMLSMMMAYVGVDPRRDVTWVAQPWPESLRLLAEGKIDAYMAFPPEPQELRAAKVGHVMVNTGLDRPWSQYFCCMVGGNAEFVRRHPVAAKRALRAILKAADLCSSQPEHVAKAMIDKGLARRYDHTIEALRELDYKKWRDYSPEETVRFYALRLHEVGMLKSGPQKIIAQGTDWRLLNEIKKELKG